MKNEKIETSTWLPVFPGFYGTLLDGERLYEDATEYIMDTIEPVELSECMVKHLYISKANDKLMEDYRDSVSRQCVNMIEQELKKLGYLEEIIFETIVSPKEYNFMNDSINIKVIFSANNVERIKAMLKEHADEWKEYLKSRYTSCSGFTSYHNNYPEADEWQVEKALQDRHNAGAILDFICAENSITDETLYYFCEQNVSVDTDMLKKECIEKGWYIPKNICKDWFRSKLISLKKYSSRRYTSIGHAAQYILDTPKQRYIFCMSKETPANDNFIIKRIFKVFMFAKLKEEKKK